MKTLIVFASLALLVTAGCVTTTSTPPTAPKPQKEGKLKATPTRCPKEGQIEVTVVKAASGKTRTICVNEAEVPKLAGEGDIVIPAVCPCDSSLLSSFQAEDYYLRCTARDKERSDEVHVRGWAERRHISQLTARYTWPSAEGMCSFELSKGTSEASNLSLDQSRACAAILWDFARHELHIDCGDEFPDFKPTP